MSAARRSGRIDTVNSSAERIRRATSDDLESLLPLIRSFYEIDQHAFEESVVRTALSPLLVDDEFGQVWVTDDGDSLGGYVVVTWGYSLESGGRECLVDEIYVEHRSSGIGARLLQTALDGARRAGARAVFLETESHNQRVRSFYARCGFEAEDSVWMSRSLS
jgi:ribosomal protein S18 acetylase RimI-like enzyme